MSPAYSSSGIFCPGVPFTLFTNSLNAAPDGSTVTSYPPSKVKVVPVPVAGSEVGRTSGGTVQSTSTARPSMVNASLGGGAFDAGGGRA